MGKHKKDARVQYIKRRKKNKKNAKVTGELSAQNDSASNLSSDISLPSDAGSSSDESSDDVQLASGKDASKTAVDQYAKPSTKSDYEGQDPVHHDPLYTGLMKLNKYKLKVKRLETMQNLSWGY